jgi:tripartite-type tricarboxylate transporter receptor subunit TctC
VKLALQLGIRRLLEEMKFLREAFASKAAEFDDVLKVGRTQLQDAVPMTLGQEFSTYAVMLGEDESRLAEAAGLIREINLGATAIGTGINAHPDYALLATRRLAEVSGIEFVSSPNLVEATQDAGSFVQLSGVLKRIAVKLSKTCNDLRLLSSGPRAGIGEISLPAVQAGSSIMPGKVNPVIPEVVNQIAFEVIGNDITVTMAAEAGQLQLNAFEPIIAHSLFKSLYHLAAGCRTLGERCVKGIAANREARAAPARRFDRAGDRAHAVHRLRALDRDRAGSARDRRARLRPRPAEKADGSRRARQAPQPRDADQTAEQQMRRLLLVLLFPLTVFAQSYPAKPVRLIVPFPVGGIADIYGRIVAARAQRNLGPVGRGRQPHRRRRQHRRGHSRQGAARRLHHRHRLDRHARGDPTLFSRMPYDAVNDFAPIVHLLEAEGLLVVHPSVPVNSVPELIAYARTNPGKLTFASAGMGTSSHLAGELFKSMARVDMNHIPYKGNTPAITDLLAGQTSLLFATMPTVLPHVKAGKLRPLATIGAQRSDAAPDLPTVAEAGLPGFAVTNWVGFFAPAKTPPEVVQRWNAETLKIMQTPEMQARLLNEGARFIAMSPEQFGAFVKSEIAKWAPVVKASGARVD